MKIGETMTTMISRRTILKFFATLPLASLFKANTEAKETKSKDLVEAMFYTEDLKKRKFEWKIHRGINSKELFESYYNSQFYQNIIKNESEINCHIRVWLLRPGFNYTARSFDHKWPHIECVQMKSDGEFTPVFNYYDMPELPEQFAKSIALDWQQSVCPDYPSKVYPNLDPEEFSFEPESIVGGIKEWNADLVVEDIFKYSENCKQGIVKPLSDVWA